MKLPKEKITKEDYKIKLIIKSTDEQNKFIEFSRIDYAKDIAQAYEFEPSSYFNKLWGNGQLFSLRP